MKKILFIGIAVLILLLALAIWGYLFLFGTPKTSNDVFANLGFSVTTTPTTVTDTLNIATTTETTQVDTTGVALKQLTVRPIAGFTTYQQSGSTTVRYMERGTGYIFDIDLATGAETRVSNTTNNRIVFATFSTDGNYVAFQSENGYVRDTYIAHLEFNQGGDGLEVNSLPPQADNMAFVGTSTLFYTLTDQNTIGYLYDYTTNSQKEVFTVPFLSVRAEVVNGTYYISNRHAPELLGTIYETDGVNFTSLLPQTFGFEGGMTPYWLLYSNTNNNKYQSYAVLQSNKNTYTLAVPYIPSKCAVSRTTFYRMWCGAPISQISETYLKEWYQGTTRSQDGLWQVDISNESAGFLADPQSLVGRELDVTALQTNYTEDGLFFINKNDDTLWYYDLLAS